MQPVRIAARILCLLVLFTAQSEAQSGKKFTVGGKLTRVMAIGGESTGWSVQFAEETTIAGQTLHSIEVSGPTDQFQQLENKQVTARGKLLHKKGVETGDRLILNVTSIKESSSK